MPIYCLKLNFSVVAFYYCCGEWLNEMEIGLGVSYYNGRKIRMDFQWFLFHVPFDWENIWLFFLLLPFFFPFIFLPPKLKIISKSKFAKCIFSISFWEYITTNNNQNRYTTWYEYSQTTIQAIDDNALVMYCYFSLQISNQSSNFRANL